MKKTFLKFSAFLLMAMIAFSLKMPVQATDDNVDLWDYYKSVYDTDYYRMLYYPDNTFENILLNVPWYLDTYNALVPYFTNTIMPNGLRGSIEFDVHTYRQNYPDLASAYGDNLPLYYYHYLNSGKAEGRVGNTALYPTSVTTTSESGTIVTGLFNPSNSKVTSPFAPEPAESLAAYPNYWTWTASNGYTLKLKVDPNSVTSKRPEHIIYEQPLSYRPDPNDAFLWAYLDYTDTVYGGEMGKPEKFFTSASALPLVDLRTEKGGLKTLSPSWIQFEEQFNTLWRPLITMPEHLPELANENTLQGMLYDLPKLKSSNASSKSKDSCVSIKMRCPGYPREYFTSKFSLVYVKRPWTEGTGGPIIHRMDDYGWILDITYNQTSPPYELMWYAIRNALRMVDPDGDLIYQQIYEQFYGGNHIFPDYDIWVPLGNSYIMALSPGDIYGSDYYRNGHADTTKTVSFFFK